MEFFKRKIIKRVIKAVISLLIIFFIARYIWLNSAFIKTFDFQIKYFLLTVSCIVLLIYSFNQYVLWDYLTRQSKCNLPFWDGITARAYSEFGKYIPGKGFGYAMLFYKYSEEDKSSISVAYSMFFELLGSVLASTFIFFVSLFFTEVPEVTKYRLVSLGLIAVFFILIHPKILNSITLVLFKITKREPVPVKISYGELLKVIGMYSGNWLIFGFAFMLFINSIFDLHFTNYLFITGTAAGSGLIGLFAVFVPAGLGVREGVMVYLLSIIMPVAIAGIISLASRLWMTLGELLLFLLIISYKKFGFKGNKESVNKENIMPESYNNMSS